MWSECPWDSKILKLRFIGGKFEKRMKWGTDKAMYPLFEFYRAVTINSESLFWIRDQKTDPSQVALNIGKQKLESVMTSQLWLGFNIMTGRKSWFIAAWDLCYTLLYFTKLYNVGSFPWYSCHSRETPYHSSLPAFKIQFITYHSSIYISSKRYKFAEFLHCNYYFGTIW